MKRELFHAMGEQMIPSQQMVDELIKKVDNRVKPIKSHKKWVIGAVAACVAVAIPAAVLLPKLPFFLSDSVLDDEANIDRARIPSWEERSYPSKYDSLFVDEELFISTKEKIDNEKIDSFLFHTTLTGYDETDPNLYIAPEKAKKYEMEADVYSVKGISPQGMVAVQYEGQEGFYTYIPNHYIPETLGEYINTLNLKENLTIETIMHSSWKDGQTIRAEYTLPDVSAVVWGLLLANTSAEYADVEKLKIYGGEMGIKVRMELASEAFETYIGVSKKGYLITNMYECLTGFYIGEDKAAAFIKYVLENGQSRQIER